MKNFIMFVMCIFVLSGCNLKNNQNNNGILDEEKISTYFPIKENTIYSYEGVGHDFSTYEAYVTYVNDNIIQRRTMYQDYEGTEVFSYTDGELKLIFSDPFVYYYEDVTKLYPRVTSVLLKEPLRVGNSWSMSDLNEDGEIIERAVREVTAIDVDVETPFGNFKALEITITHEKGDVSKEYYAKDVGLIKSTSSKDGEIIESYLSEVIPEIGFQKIFDYYSLDAEANNIVVEERTASIFTNSNLAQQFEEEFKNKTDNMLQLFSENAKINFINIDRVKSLINLDVSKSFITENSNGGGIETTILQCIANTLGNFYAADYVQITVDGDLYQSSHLSFGEDDYLQVEHSELPYEFYDDIDDVDAEGVELQ